MIDEEFKNLEGNSSGGERTADARRFWIAIASELGPKTSHHPTFDCPATATRSSLQ
jgi:hypothetical protein